MHVLTSSLVSLSIALEISIAMLSIISGSVKTNIKNLPFCTAASTTLNVKLHENHITRIQFYTQSVLREPIYARLFHIQYKKKGQKSKSDLKANKNNHLVFKINSMR